MKYDAGSGIVALPTWLSWDQGSQKLVIQPDNANLQGEYPVYATLTTTSGTPS